MKHGDRVRITPDRTPPDSEEFRIAAGKLGTVRRAGGLMVYVDWDGVGRTHSYHCSWIARAE
jgi:hypothetical protein